MSPNLEEISAESVGEIFELAHFKGLIACSLLPKGTKYHVSHHILFISSCVKILKKKNNFSGFMIIVNILL